MRKMAALPGRYNLLGKLRAYPVRLIFNRETWMALLVQ
jgi:hypothetical protein